MLTVGSSGKAQQRALGAFRVAVDNQGLPSVTPFEKDGYPSPLLAGMQEAFNHPTRVRRPAVRESWLAQGAQNSPHLRGREPFVEVPWDEALNRVTGDMARIKEADRQNKAR